MAFTSGEPEELGLAWVLYILFNGSTNRGNDRTVDPA
jgi:hypothetical protein